MKLESWGRKDVEPVAGVRKRKGKKPSAISKFDKVMQKRKRVLVYKLRERILRKVRRK